MLCLVKLWLVHKFPISVFAVRSPLKICHFVSCSVDVSSLNYLIRLRNSIEWDNATISVVVKGCTWTTFTRCNFNKSPCHFRTAIIISIEVQPTICQENGVKLKDMEVLHFHLSITMWRWQFQTTRLHLPLCPLSSALKYWNLCCELLFRFFVIQAQIE